MKILHISEAMGWGGNEQQLIYLIDELNKLGVKSYIVCVENSDLHRFINSLGVLFITIPKKKFSLSNSKKLRDFINEKSIDLVHAHKSNSIITYWISSLFYKNKVPLVYSQKGISSSTTILSKFKYNYKGIKNIICVSKYVKDNFKNMMYPKNKEKLVVVHDSVAEEKLKNVELLDLHQKYNLTKDTFIVGSIANHSLAKDLPTFVKTIDYLVNKLEIKKVHFFQVGKKTKHSTEIFKLIEELQLQQYITFTGFVNNATAYIKSFDMLLITSEREGGPSSALEAMCLKTPIVSTKTGIMPEIIVDHENGFLNEVKDFKGLASSIKKMMNEKCLDAFSEKSYALFKKDFTSSKSALKTLAVYRRLIK